MEKTVSNIHFNIRSFIILHCSELFALNQIIIQYSWSEFLNFIIRVVDKILYGN